MSLGGVGSSAAGGAGRGRYSGGIEGPGGQSFPVPEAFDSEELQKARKGVKAKDVSQVQDVDKADDAQKSDAPKLQKQPDIARQLSKKDILDHLLQLGRQFNDHNETIITTLLEYGLAASGENFEKIERLMKGRKDVATVMSSVTTLSKGLEGSPKSVDILNQFFNNQAQFSQQAQNLQSGLSSFLQAMAQGRGAMDPGLYAGLTALLNDFDDTLKKLTNKSQKERLEVTAVLRKGFVQDVKTLHEFLSGLAQKVEVNQGKTAATQQFLGQIAQFQGNLAGFLENLTMQAILSQPTMDQSSQQNFMYWQFPNPLLQVPSQVDLLIQKDKKKKNKPIDPNKTRVVIKFETPSLGMLAILLDVQDRKVWTEVHAEKPGVKQHIAKMNADLRDRLEAQDYTLMAYKIVEKPLDIKSLLLPIQPLDNLSRVSAEI